ncbi:hypothetical protein QFZ94_005413 [Paraburkholderia sp. JPY465]
MQLNLGFHVMELPLLVVEAMKCRLNANLKW